MVQLLVVVGSQRKVASGSSPGFGNLLIRDGRPGRLTVPLFLELSVEGLFNVVHVKGADGRAGDAADRRMDRGTGIEISKDLQTHTLFLFAQERKQKNKTKQNESKSKIKIKIRVLQQIQCLLVNFLTMSVWSEPLRN